MLFEVYLRPGLFTWRGIDLCNHHKIAAVGSALSRTFS